MERTGKVRTGFIGLGSQGGPMARRMVEAGYPLTLWARRPEALDAFRDTDAIAASSIADLGGQSDHVGLCVVNDAGVEQVCAELIPAMAPGSRIVIHSTVHPRTCTEIGKRAIAGGIAVIDAPVSGGGGGAASGTLTAMVGGEAEAVAAARPVIASFASTIIHLGGLGAGQMAKLVNNALMAAHVALARHALGAAETLGIDRPALIELIKVSSGRSYGFEVGARLPAPSAFRHGAMLLKKDVGLLGDILGHDADFRAFDAASSAFLAAALD